MNLPYLEASFSVHWAKGSVTSQNSRSKQISVEKLVVLRSWTARMKRAQKTASLGEKTTRGKMHSCRNCVTVSFFVDFDTPNHDSCAREDGKYGSE